MLRDAAVRKSKTGGHSYQELSEWKETRGKVGYGPRQNPFVVISSQCDRAVVTYTFSAHSHSDLNI